MARKVLMVIRERDIDHPLTTRVVDMREFLLPEDEKAQRRKVVRELGKLYAEFSYLDDLSDITLDFSTVAQPEPVTAAAELLGAHT